MAGVAVRDVPEMTVVTERRSVDQAELQAWLPGAMGRVAEAAGRLGGGLTTAAFPYLQRADHPAAEVFVVIYDGNPNEGPVPVEVCAPIDPARVQVSDAAILRLPPHREAYTRVTRQTVESGGLATVYPELERWITDNGHQVVDPPRESYWTDFFGAAATDEVFDVSFPID